MSRSAVLPENCPTSRDTPDVESVAGVRRPLAVKLQGHDHLPPNQCDTLEDAGRPLATPVRERVQFETLLADLSATFVNLPASEVDSQIVWALRRLVEFLELDRGSLA